MKLCIHCRYAEYVSVIEEVTMFRIRSWLLIVGTFAPAFAGRVLHVSRVHGRSEEAA